MSDPHHGQGVGASGHVSAAHGRSEPANTLKKQKGQTAFILGVASILAALAVGVPPALVAMKDLQDRTDHQPPESPVLVRLKAIMNEGNYQEARVGFNQAGDSADPRFLAARGECFWLATLQDLAAAPQAPTKHRLLALPDVQQALADLEKARNQVPDAVYWLGNIHEVFGETTRAHEIYQEAWKRFPTERARFQAAIDSMDRPTSR